MSLELAIQENTATLKQLITVLQSGVAMTPTNTSADATADAKKSGKKDTKKDSAEGNATSSQGAQSASTEGKTATTERSATAVTAGASDKKPEDTGPTFDDVTKKIVEINKAPAPKGGREGVLKVLAQFGCEGKKVPDLKALNKNAEIIAFVDSLLAEEADDDLGI